MAVVAAAAEVLLYSKAGLPGLRGDPCFCGKTTEDRKMVAAYLAVAENAPALSGWAERSKRPGGLTMDDCFDC